MMALAIIDEMIKMGIATPASTWDDAVISMISERVTSNVDEAANAMALTNLARVLNWAGKQEDSRRLAFQALESGAEDPTILMMVARHLALEGDTDQALVYFRRAMRANPNNPVESTMK